MERVEGVDVVQSGGMSMSRRTEPLWPRVALAVALLVVHALLSVMLAWILLTGAYASARSVPGGGSVGSLDELYKLGPSPRTGLFALPLIGAIDFLVTMVLLAIPVTRRWAWIAPTMGIVISVIVVVAALLGMHAPAPDIGG